jgi:hypothetical protein
MLRGVAREPGEVGSCTGPPSGGAGAYRCTTTPRGPGGVRSVTVAVARDGTWSTTLPGSRGPGGPKPPPPPGSARFVGRANGGMALWGAGIRLPR